MEQPKQIKKEISSQKTLQVLQNGDITKKAAEILEDQIQQTREQLPVSLKPNHLIEIMNTSKSQVYKLLKRDKIPSAKKLDGLGWRIPRDVFLSWWYGNLAKKEVKL